MSECSEGVGDDMDSVEYTPEIPGRSGHQRRRERASATKDVETVVVGEGGGDDMDSVECTTESPGHCGRRRKRRRRHGQRGIHH